MSLWVGTAMLCITAIGLKVGVPICGQHIARRDISQANGMAGTRRWELRWLDSWVGRSRMCVLEEITWVNLEDTPADDATLRNFAWLKGLTDLRVEGTDVGDEGLSRLKDLKELTLLGLGGTKVTDAGLVHLKQLSRLRVLDLSRTRVTDGGLQHLAGMTALKELSLHHTHVTAVGVERLMLAVPEVSVNGAPSPIERGASGRAYMKR